MSLSIVVILEMDAFGYAPDGCFKDGFLLDLRPLSFLDGSNVNLVVFWPALLPEEIIDPLFILAKVNLKYKKLHYLHLKTWFPFVGVGATRKSYDPITNLC